VQLFRVEFLLVEIFGCVASIPDVLHAELYDQHRGCRQFSLAEGLHRRLLLEQGSCGDSLFVSYIDHQLSPPWSKP
jgi:hypothetical protein